MALFWRKKNSQKWLLLLWIVCKCQSLDSVVSPGNPGLDFSQHHLEKSLNDSLKCQLVRSQGVPESRHSGSLPISPQCYPPGTVSRGAMWNVMCLSSNRELKEKIQPEILELIKQQRLNRLVEGTCFRKLNARRRQGTVQELSTPAETIVACFWVIKRHGVI